MFAEISHDRHHLLRKHLFFTNILKFIYMRDNENAA